MHMPSWLSFLERPQMGSGFFSMMFPQQSQRSKSSRSLMLSSTQPAFVACKCVFRCFLYGGIWSPSTSFYFFNISLKAVLPQIWDYAWIDLFTDNSTVFVPGLSVACWHELWSKNLPRKLVKNRPSPQTLKLHNSLLIPAIELSKRWWVGNTY